MMDPDSLRDMRLTPLGWPAYGWVEAERLETDKVRGTREAFMNLTHHIVNAVKQHAWEAFFTRRWADAAPTVYGGNEVAAAQGPALAAIYEKFRGQLPRSQGASAKGKRSLPPRPHALVSAADVYGTTADVMDAMYRVFDAAVAVHSAPAWTGDSLAAEEVVVRARHLRAYLAYFATEYLADTVRCLEPQRDRERADLAAIVGAKAIVAPTHEILQTILRAYTTKKGRLSTYSKWFELPADRLWPNLPAEYYAVVKSPMDFSTVEHKLGKTPGECMYATHGAFLADMHLVFANARAYNTGKSTELSREILGAATELEGDLTVAWREYMLRMWDACVRVETEATLGAAKVAELERRKVAFDRKMADAKVKLRAGLTKSAAEAAIDATLNAVAAGAPLPLSVAPEYLQTLAEAGHEDMALQHREFQAELHRLHALTDTGAAAAATARLLRASLQVGVAAIRQAPAATFAAGAAAAVAAARTATAVEVGPPVATAAAAGVKRPRSSVGTGGGGGYGARRRGAPWGGSCSDGDGSVDGGKGSAAAAVGLADAALAALVAAGDAAAATSAGHFHATVSSAEDGGDSGWLGAAVADEAPLTTDAPPPAVTVPPLVVRPAWRSRIAGAAAGGAGAAVASVFE